MKFLKLLSFSLCCVLPISVIAQWRHITTATYQQQVESLESIGNPSNALTLPATLPLVFHIVYSNDNPSFSREAVEWQVSQLNKHFSLEEFHEKKEIFKDSTYHHLAADTEIRFCLKEVFFVPTDSLHFTNFNSIKDNSTGGTLPFEPQNYLNIWVGKLVGSSGFAQMPNGVLETDGIVIDQNYFGHQPVPYSEGKTLTHLLGNSLGLANLWGKNKCLDDGVEDTPIHNAPNYNKVEPDENHISLCAGFKREMYMNYMDNTVDSMLYMFTIGQKERMHQFLSNERNHLLSSDCSSESANFRSITSSKTLLVGLKVMPNPIKNQLTINYYDEANTKAVLEIHNALGALIYTEKIGTTYQQTLPTYNWMAGVYVLSVKGTHNYSLKIIKQ